MNWWTRRSGADLGRVPRRLETQDPSSRASAWVDTDAIVRSYAPTVQFFHVSSVDNRDSINLHGLDWKLMGAARGIAGSASPEVEGCFLCQDEFEVEWFAKTINNTGGPVDVWMVAGVDATQLLERDGYHYLPAPINRHQLSHLRTEDASH